MANPNYASLLAQIAAETDPVIKQQLIELCYVFEQELTREEKELFEYCEFDYVEDNPGYGEGTGDPLYVLAGYVADGYINNISSNTSLYVLSGYMTDGYVATQVSGDNFISYVGTYFNDNGDRT